MYNTASLPLNACARRPPLPGSLSHTRTDSHTHAPKSVDSKEDSSPSQFLKQTGAFSDADLLRLLLKITNTQAPPSTPQQTPTYTNSQEDGAWVCNACDGVNAWRTASRCTFCGKSAATNAHAHSGGVKKKVSLTPRLWGHRGFSALNKLTNTHASNLGLCLPDDRMGPRPHTAMPRCPRARTGGEGGAGYAPPPPPFRLRHNYSNSANNNLDMHAQIDELLCNALDNLTCSSDTHTHSQGTPQSEWTCVDPDQTRAHTSNMREQSTSSYAHTHTPTKSLSSYARTHAQTPTKSVSGSVSFLSSGSSTDTSPSTANAHNREFLTPFEITLLKSKDVAERLLLDFQDLGDADPCGRSLEVLNATLSLLGKANDFEGSEGKKVFSFHGIGGPHFAAPAMLAHPDEFKNPSSFLKIYGDPMCGAEASARTPSGACIPQLPQPINGKDGNWMCHVCGNVNFPRRFRCNKCSEQRGPEGDAIVTEYAQLVHKHHQASFRLLAASQGIDAPPKRPKGKRKPLALAQQTNQSASLGFPGNALAANTQAITNRSPNTNTGIRDAATTAKTPTGMHLPLGDNTHTLKHNRLPQPFEPLSS